MKGKRKIFSESWDSLRIRTIVGRNIASDFSGAKTSWAGVKEDANNSEEVPVETI